MTGNRVAGQLQLSSTCIYVVTGMPWWERYGGGGRFRQLARGRSPLFSRRQIKKLAPHVVRTNTGIRVSEKVPSIRVYSVPNQSAPISSRGDDADGIRVR